MNANDTAALARLHRIADGGGTLAEARVAAGLSLEQAALLSGIDKGRLIAVEDGGVHAHTAQEHMLLLTVYDVPGFNSLRGRPPGNAREVRQCRDCGACWLAGDTERHTGQCVLMRCARTHGGGHGFE